jgi:hypothetical protein
MICGFLQQTDWKHCLEIEKDNTALESINNGESVLSGKMAMRSMLKLLTIIEVII